MDDNMQALLGGFDFNKLLQMQKEDETANTQQEAQTAVPLEDMSMTKGIPGTAGGSSEDGMGMNTLASIASIAMLFL